MKLPPDRPSFAPSSRAGGFQMPHLRWLIVGMVFLATVINFLDRMTVSVLAPVIRENLHLSNFDYAKIGTCFLVAYTLSQALSGKFYDRVGTKRGFTFSIIVWSSAAIGHAFAGGFAGLCVARAFLGIGEAGNWPGAAKTVAEWFPGHERAFAMGIFNSGTSFGAIIAPPVIIWLQWQFGWQAAFIATGLLGFLWLAVWLAVFHPVATHPWLTAAERGKILAGQEAPSPEGTALPPTRWRDLLRIRGVWAILLARLLVDPIWWLYILWLPEYLSKARGLSLVQIGMFAWIPFVAADVGSLLGGYLSGWLIRRGWSTNRARKTIIACAALLMPLGFFATRADGVGGALAWMSVVTFGFQVWINNVQTLPSDLFSQRAVATVMGLGGFGAGVGSIIFNLATGWVVDHFSYTPILVAASMLAPIGTAVLFLLVGRVEPSRPRDVVASG